MSVTYERVEDGREWAVVVGEPDLIQHDGGGRRVHKLTRGELFRHDGLDRALSRAGLERCNEVPWGNDGGEVWFAERTGDGSIGG